MANHFFLLAAALMLSVSGFAHAANDYRCTIERVISGGGSAQAHKLQETLLVGKQFTVERRTGIMAGALKNSYVTKPQVIDVGSNQNSFKAVTTMRVGESGAVGSTMYALTVREYEQSPQKPFVFLENDLVYTGICEHF